MVLSTTDWFPPQIMMMNGYICSQRCHKISDEWKPFWQNEEETYFYPSSSSLPSLYVCFSVTAHMLSVPCAALSPDVDTDFYSNKSLCELYLAEGCMTHAVPADAGMLLLVVSLPLCLSSHILLIWFLSLSLLSSSYFVFRIFQLVKPLNRT